MAPKDRRGTTKPQQPTARQVERVAVEGLKPYARNARTHSKRQIKQIARSIAQYGFTNPVLIDESGMVLCGHGRLAAAKLLGWKDVPALRIEHLGDAQKRAYVLADNKIAANAGWNREFLQTELQGLIDLGFDVELTGFEMPEIDFLLEDRAAASSDLGPEDFIPDLTTGAVISQSGDIWLLGDHWLLCGDARDSAAYRRLLRGSKAQLVFTDPPYNVRIAGNVSGLGSVRHKDFAMASGEMTRAEFTAFLQGVCEVMAENTSNGSIHYICIDWRHIGELLSAGGRVYGNPKNLCVWTKNNAGMGTFYRSKHELVVVFKNGTAEHINNFELGQHGRSRSNVWDYPGVNTFKRGRLDELAMHPTVKPVALVEDALKDCSRRGALVLDPFGGSGTTLIAAERTGRHARLMEIDPRYCDVIVRRWQTFTGKPAVHAQTKRSFEDREEEIREPAPPVARTRVCNSEDWESLTFSKRSASSFGR